MHQPNGAQQQLNKSEKIMTLGPFTNDEPSLIIMA
jgi:hypothetical protein